MNTGGLDASQEARMGDLRTVDESGAVGERKEEEQENTDIEDEENDMKLIIRDPKGRGTSAYALQDGTR